MNLLDIDATWSLFLDRDGVINTRKMGGYIQSVDEFKFLPGALQAIVDLSPIFKHIFVVTNQQGIGKGIMSESNLLDIHRYMLEQVEEQGGKITKFYHAPALSTEKSNLRKPDVGMGLKAKVDFPDVDFSKSIMVGDSDSDIQFGINLAMKTVRVTLNDEDTNADLTVKSLEEFKNLILRK